MAQDLPPLLGESPAFADLLDQVSAAAALDRPVLVIGERGTGKELIAARLHFLSPRWDRAFVKLDCAALSPELLESELFGHEAGAFTGAVRRHIGRFERADGGTLFLDELANASLRVQEKLLRAIEYGEIERVGGTQAMTVDVRVVAATNVDLPGEVAAGRFRGDLLDRLAFDVLTVPPLRARPEDIPLLAGAFALAMTRTLDRPGFPGFAPAVMAMLCGHGWPGNIRELKNAVERAVYRTAPDQPVSDIVLDPFASPWRPRPAGAAADMDAMPAPPGAAPPTGVYDFRAALAAVEKTWLETALAGQGGHQGRAATALGLGYDQLRHLLRKHGITARQGGDNP